MREILDIYAYCGDAFVNVSSEKLKMVMWNRGARTHTSLYLRARNGVLQLAVAHSVVKGKIERARINTNLICFGINQLALIEGRS